MSRYVVTATWDDCPHLTQEVKDEYYDSIPIHLREARTKGVPSLGAGAIYPVDEEDVACAPFPLPEHWPKVYGMDVGWNKTAAIWGAFDRETDTVYLYVEHYRGFAEPSIHADAIKARGDWIPGVIDPASRGRSQKDGSKLLTEYHKLRLKLAPADNAVEAGLHAVFQRLSSGRLKVFSNCRNWLSEYRLYRRNEKGKIVKERDHLMDATRYLIMTGLLVAKTKPVPEGVGKRRQRVSAGGWMGN
jgi:hypothetical protein